METSVITMNHNLVLSKLLVNGFFELDTVEDTVIEVCAGVVVEVTIDVDNTMVNGMRVYVIMAEYVLNGMVSSSVHHRPSSVTLQVEQSGNVDNARNYEDTIEFEDRIGESSFSEFDVQFDSLDESEEDDGSLNMDYEVECEDVGEHNFAKEGDNVEKTSVDDVVSIDLRNLTPDEVEHDFESIHGKAAWKTHFRKLERSIANVFTRVIFDLSRPVLEMSSTMDIIKCRQNFDHLIYKVSMLAAECHEDYVGQREKTINERKMLRAKKQYQSAGNDRCIVNSGQYVFDPIILPFLSASGSAFASTFALISACACAYVTASAYACI
ncbi:hypothetical protein VNO78_17961 [Psophocarpus tetragonolobus]|uniref:Uncharacterized protein n=1 Tax=Psophocarpus tetragonolobus TaxID=3891 RepID=A0AAN9SIL3_PSOTE